MTNATSQSFEGGPGAGCCVSVLATSTWPEDVFEALCTRAFLKRRATGWKIEDGPCQTGTVGAERKAGIWMNYSRSEQLF